MLSPPEALEALLFAAGEPVTKKDLAKLLEIEENKVQAVVESLAKTLTNSGLVLVDTGREVELRTTPAAAPIVKRLRESELSKDLGKASLETLATIAYRPGSTRSEVDWVRGVNSAASMRTLLIRGLIAGEEDEKDRRKIRYRLTSDALAHLGARSAKDLPRFAELSKGADAAATPDEGDK